MKSPALATVLSLMPGLGQVYVGYYQQGFVNVTVIASLIAILNYGAGRLEPFCAFFLVFFWLFNLVDAYRKASFYNLALAGAGPFTLPDDLEMPHSRGSLVGGITLMGLGLLFLSHTWLGYSLAWLEDWWPLGLVLTGGYLTFRAVQQYRRGQEAKH